MKSIEFTVLGFPAPKGSVRAAGNQVIPSGSPQNRNAQKSWGQDVREAASKALDLALGVGNFAIPFMGVPVRVTIVWRMQRPLGHYHKKGAKAGQIRDGMPKYHTTKPDSSKLLRCLEDDLNKLVFDDDSRIAETMMRKVYADPGKEGAWVKIELLEDK